MSHFLVALGSHRGEIKFYCSEMSPDPRRDGSGPEPSADSAAMEDNSNHDSALLPKPFFPQNKDDERSLALLDATPPSTPPALRLDRMALTHPGAMLDDPRDFRR